MNLCPSCREMNKTHQAPTTKCTGGALKGYNNCFDKNACDKLEVESDIDILRGIITSGCLSMNHTKLQEAVVRRRLEFIIQKLPTGS